MRIRAVSVVPRWRAAAWACAMLLAAACVGQLAGPAAATTPSDPSFSPGQTVQVISGPTALDIPAGQCRTVEQTAWVTAMESVPIQSRADFGPNTGRLTCDFALERAASQAEEKCRVNYSGASLYRNGRLVSVDLGRSNCSCNESGGRTRCTVSTTAQCGYEAQQTRSVQLCN